VNCLVLGVMVGVVGGGLAEEVCAKKGPVGMGYQNEA